jgi:hypothetical protein
MTRAAALAALAMIGVLAMPAHAQAPTREQAMRAAIHPVANEAEMREWLARVPVTRDWPPDFVETMKGQGPAFIVEMSTAPGCVPCADLWTRFSALGGRYGWKVRTISAQDALLRSGRLGLPWVGHPVAWVRPIADSSRIVPVAIGTDHAPNLARNLYLAAKMLTGVKPAVGVRGMSKFTGIVGAPMRPSKSRARN